MEPTNNSKLRTQNQKMGPGRVELPTSRLSGVRSNQLSYEPFNCGFQILDCGLKQKIQTTKYNPLSTIWSRPDSLAIQLKKSNKKPLPNWQRFLETISLPQLRPNLQQSVNSVQIHLPFPPSSVFACGYAETSPHRPIKPTTPVLAYQA